MEGRLRSNVDQFRSLYYINVHRLDSLYREQTNKSFLDDVPHSYSAEKGHYNTLWGNEKNSLDWMKLAENRAFFESCLFEVVPTLTMIDINLLELRAIDPSERIGSLVGFSCEFAGQDIPMQSELVSTNGELCGPGPTLRREVMDAVETESVTETCLILDPTYMYSESAFIHLSEQGIWNGFGILARCRAAVGSNDGHLARRQVVVSPVCIGLPMDRTRYSAVPPDSEDADHQHQRLVRRFGDTGA